MTKLTLQMKKEISLQPTISDVMRAGYNFLQDKLYDHDAQFVINLADCCAKHIEKLESEK